MSDVLPLVRKLQAEATNSDASVTNLLRMAKIAATKLNLTDALVWIDRELNGYSELTTEDLPSYRRLTGIPKGYNPYHGWQTIHFPDSETAEKFSQAPIGLALGAIEQTVSPSDHYSFPYPAEVKAVLQKAMRVPVDVHISIDASQLLNIVDQVRNLILNWALELEKAGVLGEDMQFSEQEKGDAKPVTQQFIIQTVGVLGNVSDQATVTNQQNATAKFDLDFGQIRDFIAHARAMLPMLPAATQKAVGPLLGTIDDEIKKEKPAGGKIRAVLTSVQKICEGAAGNLTAQGIIGMLRAILGA
jgi:hypothetical protein